MLRLPIYLGREKDNDLSLKVVYITKIQFSRIYNSSGKYYFIPIQLNLKIILFLIKIEEIQKLKLVPYI